MKPKVKLIKKRVPRQKYQCTPMFVNLKLICSLLMLMLHVAILRWPHLSPWCYWLEKVQRWEAGSAFCILRSLLTSEPVSTIPSYLRTSYDNKQVLLSDFQAWGSWPFTKDWEEFGCAGSPGPSSSPSPRVCHGQLCPAEKPASPLQPCAAGGCSPFLLAGHPKRVGKRRAPSRHPELISELIKLPHICRVWISHVTLYAGSAKQQAVGKAQ